MKKTVWTLASLCAAAMASLAGCGGGGGGGNGHSGWSNDLGGMKAATSGSMDAGIVTRPAAAQPYTQNALAPTDAPSLKADEAFSPRPPMSSNFRRENTYRIYATTGIRQWLRLDFQGARYEILQDAESPNGGTSTSGSFSEDPLEPGTYVFSTDRIAGPYNTARFRIAQGVVVGGFPFGNSHPSSDTVPFVGANNFIADRQQLDGEYLRLGVRYQTISEWDLPLVQTTPLRISGGGTSLEICATLVLRFDQCTSINRYTLSYEPSTDVWSASGSLADDKFEFRMARVAGQKIWLESSADKIAGTSGASFYIGVPVSSPWASGRYVGAAMNGWWSTIDLGQKYRAAYRRFSKGPASFDSALINSRPDLTPPGAGTATGSVFAQGAGLLVTNLQGALEIALFKEALQAEPPAPFNGTYRVFAPAGKEYALSLDFNAGSYQMSDGASDNTTGTFSEDAADPGTYIFSSSRVSLVYNTARFRIATDGIVGAFPFEAYRSSPATYRVMPFVAARSFATTRPELEGTFDLLSAPGGAFVLRINPTGTTAVQCYTTDCSTTSGRSWTISQGTRPGQWVLANGTPPSLNIYVARFGSRRVLFSVGDTVIPTIPPTTPATMAPFVITGFSQPPVGGSNPNWSTYSLHTASGSSFGTATLSNTGYSQQHLDQAGQPSPLVLNFEGPLPGIPSIRYALNAGTVLSAQATHNGELFLMHSMAGMFVGLIDR